MIIISQLWRKYPQTAAEIVQTQSDGKTLRDSTVRTLLRRLTAKKAIGYVVDEKNTNLYRYYPLVCETDCIIKEIEKFMDIYFGNDIRKMLNTMIRSFDLSNEKIEQLKNVLDEKN